MFWKALGWIILKLMGWHTVYQVPAGIKKAVLVAAPHTSNWDFPICMAALKVMNVKFKFLGKIELFTGPMGWLFYALGGVPVDRSKHNSMVEAMAQVIKDADELILLIPPEGTRSAVTEWKTGFYHVARLAGVPILPGYLDYKKKEAGIAEPFHLKGEFDADLAEIKAFYRTITPLYPEKWKV